MNTRPHQSDTPDYEILEYFAECYPALDEAATSVETNAALRVFTLSADRSER